MASNGRRSNNKLSKQNTKNNLEGFFTDKTNTVNQETKKKNQTDGETTEMGEMAALLEKHTETIVNKIDNLAEEVNDIKKKFSDIEKAIENHDAEFVDVKSQVRNVEEKLRNEIETLKAQNLERELYSRKLNILIYGIRNTVSDKDLSDVIRSIFIDKLKIDREVVESMLFVNYHRLPSRKMADGDTNDPGKSVPVIVKFVKFTDRETIITAARQNGKNLATEKLRILTDLPQSLKILRGKLAFKAYHLRNGRLKLQTRIVERGTSVTLAYRKDVSSPWKNIQLDEEPDI